MSESSIKPVHMQIRNVWHKFDSYFLAVIKKKKIFRFKLSHFTILLFLVSLEGSLSANLSKPAKSFKDNSDWSSPIRLAYDFNDDHIPAKDDFPENDDNNEAIALVDRNEMYRAVYEQKTGSCNDGETMLFIGMLARIPYSVNEPRLPQSNKTNSGSAD